MDEETYTPPQAAKILRVSRQRVTQMLNAGELEGRQDPETGRWSIPQRTVHARLGQRPLRTSSATSEGPQEAPERTAELELEVRELERALGRLEGRLELTEQTESTLRADRERLLADLERERERATRLEEELREARRGFWRRFFGLS